MDNQIEKVENAVVGGENNDQALFKKLFFALVALVAANVLINLITFIKSIVD